MHVIDPEIIAIAVAQLSDTGCSRFARSFVGDAAPLHRRMFFLRDTEREFGKMGQFTLALLLERFTERAELHPGEACEPAETQTDDAVKTKADGKPDRRHEVTRAMMLKYVVTIAAGGF
jgi:hypothetical protein